MNLAAMQKLLYVGGFFKVVRIHSHYSTDYNMNSPRTRIVQMTHHVNTSRSNLAFFLPRVLRGLESPEHIRSQCLCCDIVYLI